MIIKGSKNENRFDFSESDIESKLYHPDLEYEKI